MTDILTFDIEIAREIPKDTEDWSTLRPYGISCAATMVSGAPPALWHGRRERDGRLAAQMSVEECRDLAQYLVEAQAAGYTVVTFNGLGFDFDVLNEECEYIVTHDIIGLALNHIDIAFAMFCDKGFMVGLNAAAKGMGLEGKTEGMSGALAPVMWGQGREEQEKVLEYVAQDVVTTLELYEEIVAGGFLRWISKRGRVNHWDPVLIGTDITTQRLMTVSEALAMSEPDVSWMTGKPWTREKFCGWTVREESK